MIKINSDWLHKYRIHIIVWSIFITYETVVIGLVYGIYGNPLTYLLHYIVIVSFFYACSDIGIPWAFLKPKKIWWKLPLLFIPALTIYIIFHYLADLILIYLGVIESEVRYKLSYQFILKNLYRGSYFFGFSTGYYLLKVHDIERGEHERLTKLNFENLLKQQQTTKELSLIQNAFLKAQINPHFLFNTLDFIYHSIFSNPEAVAEAIIYLSRTMRFAIDANEQGEFIRVGEEIKHVQTLLNLYQLRKKDINIPRLKVSPEAERLFFIPLVILTLAENMIKHGLFNKLSDTSYINLEVVNGLFIIETRNIIDRNGSKINSGAGLRNIENRLRFVYGEALTSSYNEDHFNNFIVRITIPAALLATPLQSDSPFPAI